MLSDAGTAKCGMTESVMASREVSWMEAPTAPRQRH